MRELYSPHRGRNVQLILHAQGLAEERRDLPEELQARDDRCRLRRGVEMFKKAQA
jgi:hypothetical protein